MLSGFPGRRIIVTPGMVEQGEKEEEPTEKVPESLNVPSKPVKEKDSKNSVIVAVVAVVCVVAAFAVAVVIIRKKKR